jgi:hypothetical protein
VTVILEQKQISLLLALKVMHDLQALLPLGQTLIHHQSRHRLIASMPLEDVIALRSFPHVDRILLAHCGQALHQGCDALINPLPRVQVPLQKSRP